LAGEEIHRHCPEKRSVFLMARFAGYKEV
jgi:hypothetical protein